MRGGLRVAHAAYGIRHAARGMRHAVRAQGPAAASGPAAAPRTLCHRSVRPRWRPRAAPPAKTGPRCSSTLSFHRQFWP